MKIKLIILLQILFFLEFSLADSFINNFSRVPDGEGETYISGFDFTNEKVTYSIFGDVAVYGGDIILGTVEDMESRKESYENNDTNLSKSFVKLGATIRWKNGIVLYSLDPDMPADKRQQLYEAINEWETYTVIRFQPITDYQKSIGKKYIKYHYANPCESTTGSEYGAYANIKGCSLGGLIHELGHTVGLFHEQQRFDRDNYINILWENVNSDYTKQFNTFGNTDNIMGPYDYSSVMHYSATAASGVFDYDTYKWKPTMVAKNGAELGNNRLSIGDIQTVNKIYSIHIATIVSPINEAHLSSTSTRFRWTNTYGDGVILRITDSNNNIITQGYQDAQSKLVNNLPSDGSTINVELRTNTMDGWVTKNYTYTSYLAKPKNPSNILLSDSSYNGITLKWVDNTNTEQGYRIYKDSILIATLPVNTTNYKIENLDEDTTYTYTIKAFNSSGESSPLTVTFKTDKNIAWMIPAIYYPMLMVQ